jgi:hypothetical protein
LVALAGLIGVALDYVLKRDQLELVSAAEIRGRAAETPEPQVDAAFVKRLAVQIGMTIAMLAIAVIVLIVIVGSIVASLR